MDQVDTMATMADLAQIAELQSTLAAIEEEAKMTITPAERQKALDIRHAIQESTAEIPIVTLSDYKCVCYAITCGHLPMNEVLDTIYKVQAFREQYHKEESLQDAIFSLRRFVHHMPGFLLDVSYLYSGNNYSITMDIARIYPSEI